MENNIAMQNVLTFWGDDAPEWVIALGKACDQATQSKIASKIGYSTTAVNQVLKNRYNADLKTFEKAVRGGLLNSLVQCPILGGIRENECLVHQRRPFAITNAQRVRMYKACRTCPNRMGADS